MKIFDKNLLKFKPDDYRLYRFYSVANFGYLPSGAVHFVFIFVFAYIGITELAVFNIFSTAIFTVNFFINRRGYFKTAYLLTVFEVIAHAVFATIEVGFETGFYFHLISLIPFLFYFPQWNFVYKLLLAALISILFVFCYLHSYFGFTAHIIPSETTAILNIMNIVIIIAIISTLSTYYSFVTIQAEQKILAANEELKKLNEQISDQKEELELLNDELQEANAAKDRFFSIIAHDLKNPFNVLLTGTEFTLQELPNLSREKIERRINDVLDSARTIYNLLNDLLEWARSQAGRITIEAENLNIKTIVNETFELLGSNAREKNIALLNEAEDSAVFADKNMLTTIIRNLVSNAIKFTPREGNITVSSGVKNSDVEVIISDTGQGISEENQKKLFKIDENFTTRGTNNEKGAGLGLILVAEFVKKNGGSIKVESKPGKGSDFIFTVPAGDDTLIDKEKVTYTIGDNSEKVSQKKKELFDENTLAMLKEKGYFEEAEKLSKVLQISKIREFAVILKNEGEHSGSQSLVEFAAGLDKAATEFDITAINSSLSGFLASVNSE
jgi:signal transduction histidine kinase